MPEGRSRLVLVGFMGCGKSTVGRLVSRRLGWGFEDMDRRIEQRAGRAVAAIFAEQGEEAFRVLEREEARALQRETRCVIAAGGGAFTREDTRALLQQGAVTVWLRVTLDTALARVPLDGSRPLAGSRDIMRALLAEREPSYSRADATVDAGAPPEEVAERVLALVRGRTAEKRTRRR